jgi:hypothetical protein
VKDNTSWQVMLIDGKWSVIGSANLDQKFSQKFQYVIVSSTDFGKQVDEMFAGSFLADLPRST